MCFPSFKTASAIRKKVSFFFHSLIGFCRRSQSRRALLSIKRGLLRDKLEKKKTFKVLGNLRSSNIDKRRNFKFTIWIADQKNKLREILRRTSMGFERCIRVGIFIRSVTEALYTRWWKFLCRLWKLTVNSFIRCMYFFLGNSLLKLKRKASIKHYIMAKCNQLNDALVDTISFFFILYYLGCSLIVFGMKMLIYMLQMHRC